jgi:SOS response regulatory protein OraA/RecX
MAQHKGLRLRKLEVATWNIRGITGKKELQTGLQKRKIDRAVITETKKRNKCSEDQQTYRKGKLTQKSLQSPKRKTKAHKTLTSM